MQGCGWHACCPLPHFSPSRPLVFTAVAGKETSARTLATAHATETGAAERPRPIPPPPSTSAACAAVVRAKPHRTQRRAGASSRVVFSKFFTLLTDAICWRGFFHCGSNTTSLGMRGWGLPYLGSILSRCTPFSFTSGSSICGASRPVLTAI